MAPWARRRAWRREVQVQLREVQVQVLWQSLHAVTQAQAQAQAQTGAGVGAGVGARQV